jgi:hypothetical protein
MISFTFSIASLLFSVNADIEDDVADFQKNFSSSVI